MQKSLQRTEGPALPTGTKIVAGAFLVSGVVHLIRPTVFRPLIPSSLGDPMPWISGSGVAEIVCAVGLLTRQRWAPTATAVTLSIIWVGNFQMAITIQRAPSSTRVVKAATWLRLPLQIPLIRWAWKSPRSSEWRCRQPL